MFNLSDLKQTRFYQEVFAEGQAELQKAAIPRMVRTGLTPSQISAILDLPIAEVEAMIAATIAQDQN